jgi:hypothetical protein
MARILRRALWPALVLALLASAPATTATAATPPHYALEQYALRLINCTRTGGWVLKDGTCVDYGTGRHSRYRPPLKLRADLSNLVSRPYALRIARANYCGHNYGGRTILGAFRSKGFMGIHFGENVGCDWTGHPKLDVLLTFRMMQAEKATGGWHWRNIKNRDFSQVGIGVAVVGRQTRIVEDFYHP